MLPQAHAMGHLGFRGALKYGHEAAKLEDGINGILVVIGGNGNGLYVCCCHAGAVPVQAAQR